ncbi:hypothetical protein [Actinomadura rudentiformis]|uniref:Uncharacterized protein n=1 Tax=Actinomadura rudentiformis TaxID=359158 RepID=A0A6H9YAB4_9ACTN|nr:hypothetical protein [Actinomadura rudentiformis]KAB2340627.1 hypothetical protein F8566_44735 [Actinomadura rudentiformis]
MQEELARRLAGSRQRIEELQRQLAEVQARLEAEEDRLSRLMITQETVEEILGETPQVAEPLPGNRHIDTETREAESNLEVVRRGVMLVPSWEPVLGISVLPRAYRDAPEVLADASGAMRANKISMALGRGESAAKVEGLAMPVRPAPIVGGFGHQLVIDRPKMSMSFLINALGALHP